LHAWFYPQTSIGSVASGSHVHLGRQLKKGSGKQQQYAEKAAHVFAKFHIPAERCSILSASFDIPAQRLQF
jgi:hypothetical protein